MKHPETKQNVIISQLHKRSLSSEAFFAIYIIPLEEKFRSTILL